MNSALAAPQKSTGSSAHWPWVLLVALLIAFKSIYMGFDVTPPGDMPDESGHYSYAQDIANGKLFPLLGEATVRRDIWREPIDTERQPRENYIVQHPPLYYAVAAIPYAIAKLFTDDRWYLIRVTRMVSALSLGLLVLVLFKTIHEAGVGAPRALLVASSVAFIPMITNLSSGITNDIFLFLLCALATRHLVRFVQHQFLKDAYLCAFWLCMAGGTKMTAWILIAGFVCIIVYEMRRSIASWFLHSAGVTLVSLVLPLWWMGRNLYHFGNPFKVNVVSTPPIMLNYSVIDYLKSYPYLDWMLVHFYGLIGFSGYCQTPERIEQCMGVKSTRISSQPYEFMVVVLAALSLAFVAYALIRFYRLFRTGKTEGPASSVQMWISAGVGSLPWRWICLLLLGAAGISLYLYGVLHFHQEPGFISGLAKVMLLSACLLAMLGLGFVMLDTDATQRVIFYAPLLFFGFGLAIALQSHKAFVLVGELRGLQGRYFYPYLPILLTSIALVLERIKAPTAIYLWIVLGLVWGELHAYVKQVIPFFEYVKI